MGLNLGLADADALAWRLAAVVRGWADATVLDDYHVERQALAERTAAWTRANLNTVARLLGAAARDDEAAMDCQCAELGGYVDHPGLDLGPLLPPAANDATRLVDDGRPGSRGPHVPLGASGRSTLDLYGSAPVLLVDRATGTAAAGGTRASEISGVPLTVTSLAGQTNGDTTWWSRHGVARDGAVLIRPDGYVSWRTERVGERSVPDLTGALLELARR